MQRKWRFFGFFVVYSFIFSIAWFFVYGIYTLYPLELADVILHLIGYSGKITDLVLKDTTFYIRFPEYAPDRAYSALNVVFNVVPFVTLVLATPRVTLIKRLQVLIYGLLILFVLHALSIVAMFFRAATQFPWKDVVYYFFATLLEAIAPILIWLMYLGKEYFFKRRILK